MADYWLTLRRVSSSTHTKKSHSSLEPSLGAALFGLTKERSAWRAWPCRHGNGGREGAGWRPAKGVMGVRLSPRGWGEED